MWTSTWYDRRASIREATERIMVTLDELQGSEAQQGQILVPTLDKCFSRRKTEKCVIATSDAWRDGERVEDRALIR